MVRNASGLLVLSGALACGACSHRAHAVVTGVVWREVDNSAAIQGANGWNETNRTFDLYVLGAAGDIVHGVAAGGDNNPNLGITILGGEVYTHPLGGNTRSFAFENFFPEIRFDNYACFGGTALMDGQATSFAGTTDLVGADGRISFSSFTAPPVILTADAQSPGGGSIRVLRVSVTASAVFLGGHGPSGNPSRVQLGLPGGVVADFLVPNAIPHDLPSPFALTGPPPAATCFTVAPPPTFTWEPSQFALEYDLHVSLDPDFQLLHYVADGLASPTHTPPPWTVDRGHTYYWRVIARNDVGDTVSTPSVASLATVFAGDVDQNGSVFFPDLNYVLSTYGTRVGDLLYNPLIDLNHDGAINFLDLNIVLSNLRRVCAP